MPNPSSRASSTHSLTTTLLEHVRSLLPAEQDVVASHHLTDLWAGYGTLHRLVIQRPPPPSTTSSNSSQTLQDDDQYTLILKHIALPATTSDFSLSSARKSLSYIVETNFYRFYTSLLPLGVNTPTIVGFKEITLPRSSATTTSPERLLLLSDLKPDYPLFAERRGELDPQQAELALQWLADFHATFFDVTASSDASPVAARRNVAIDTQAFCPPPTPSTLAEWDPHAANKRGSTAGELAGGGLWQQGGYTYLATRLSELRAIRPTARWGKLGLHAASPLPYAVDWCLRHPRDRRRLTLCHGDVKAANMAFSPTGTHSRGTVAFYDFQYVGVSLGVQDLAKFFTTSIPEDLLESPLPTTLLRRYHDLLTTALPPEARGWYPYVELEDDFKLALVAWTCFLAGWSGGFWGNVDWHQRAAEHILRDDNWTSNVIERWRTEGGGEKPDDRER